MSGAVMSSLSQRTLFNIQLCCIGVIWRKPFYTFIILHLKLRLASHFDKIKSRPRYQHGRPHQSKPFQRPHAYRKDCYDYIIIANSFMIGNRTPKRKDCYEKTTKSGHLLPRIYDTPSR
nr:MAG TPA: hypothetical protein [Caudoviricetes sp.]